MMIMMMTKASTVKAHYDAGSEFTPNASDYRPYHFRNLPLRNRFLYEYHIIGKVHGQTKMIKTAES